MRTQAAKGRRLLLLVAVLVLLGGFLTTIPAEASRDHSPPLTAALEPDLLKPSFDLADVEQTDTDGDRFALFTTDDLSLLAALALLDASELDAINAENRIRLFVDSSRLPRPVEAAVARKTASGVLTCGLGINVRETGGLSENCVGPSFQGLWHDPVTGLAYARNRWYDPRTAHWLSPDPMGPVDSPNLYAFVGWRPHMARDPRGMATEAGFDWFLATKDLSAEERADYRRGYFEGQLMGARFVAEMGAEELTPAGIANGFSGAFFGYDFIRRERVTGFLGRGSYALAALPFVPTSIRYLDEAAEAADVLRVTRFLDDAPGPGLLDEATVPRTGGINPALQVRRDAYVAWKGRAGIEGTPTSARFRRFMGAHRPGSRGSTLYASRSGFRSPKLGVRNPWGRRGSPAHQARIGQAETRLGTRGWDTFSGGSLPEVKFGARYPDLVMVNDGRRIAIQVGRVTSRGVPVSREFEALADLRATGMFDHVFFLRY